jgi:hypothetical protein
VDRPPADVAKGGCYLNGSATAGVDTGVNIDFEGTLFLSNSAIKELAEVAGFSVNEEGIELERRNAELEHEIEELKALVTAQDEELQAVAIVFARGRDKK